MLFPLRTLCQFVYFYYNNSAKNIIVYLNASLLISKKSRYSKHICLSGEIGEWLNRKIGECVNVKH